MTPLHEAHVAHWPKTQPGLLPSYTRIYLCISYTCGCRPLELGQILRENVSPLEHVPTLCSLRVSFSYTHRSYLRTPIAGREVGIYFKVNVTLIQQLGHYSLRTISSPCFTAVSNSNSRPHLSSQSL